MIGSAATATKQLILYRHNKLVDFEFAHDELRDFYLR